MTNHVKSLMNVHTYEHLVNNRPNCLQVDIQLHGDWNTLVCS